VEREKAQVVLPGLCKLYSSDFGDRSELLAFAGRHMDQRLDGLRVRFASFDWTLVPQP
jgi:hypothetical protein